MTRLPESKPQSNWRSHKETRRKERKGKEEQVDWLEEAIWLEDKAERSPSAAYGYLWSALEKYLVYLSDLAIPNKCIHLAQYNASRVCFLLSQHAQLTGADMMPGGKRFAVTKKLPSTEAGNFNDQLDRAKAKLLCASIQYTERITAFDGNSKDISLDSEHSQALYYWDAMFNKAQGHFALAEIMSSADPALAEIELQSCLNTIRAILHHLFRRADLPLMSLSILDVGMCDPGNYGPVVDPEVLESIADALLLQAQVVQELEPCSNTPQALQYTLQTLLICQGWIIHAQADHPGLQSILIQVQKGRCSILSSYASLDDPLSDAYKTLSDEYELLSSTHPSDVEILCDYADALSAMAKHLSSYARNNCVALPELRIRIQKAYSKALQLYSKAQQLQPSHVDILSTIGDHYLLLADTLLWTDAMPAEKDNPSFDKSKFSVCVENAKVYYGIALTTFRSKYLGKLVEAFWMNANLIHQTSERQSDQVLLSHVIYQLAKIRRVLTDMERDVSDFMELDTLLPFASTLTNADPLPALSCFINFC